MIQWLIDHGPSLVSLTAGLYAMVRARTRRDTATNNRNMRVNGAVQGTSNGAIGALTDGENLTLGARTSGIDPVSFDYQAWLIGPAMTTAQRAEAFALIKYLTGIG